MPVPLCGLLTLFLACCCTVFWKKLKDRLFHCSIKNNSRSYFFPLRYNPIWHISSHSTFSQAKAHHMTKDSESCRSLQRSVCVLNISLAPACHLLSMKCNDLLLYKFSEEQNYVQKQVHCSIIIIIIIIMLSLWFLYNVLHFQLWTASFSQ